MHASDYKKLGTKQYVRSPEDPKTDCPILHQLGDDHGKSVVSRLESELENVRTHIYADEDAETWDAGFGEEHGRLWPELNFQPNYRGQMSQLPTQLST